METDGLSLILSFVAIAVSVVFAWRGERSSAKQHDLETTSMMTEWFRDITGWASETIDVLSEAIYLTRPGQPVEESEAAYRLYTARYRISALIDRGRFMFPNVRRNDHGLTKESAYRGYRHAVLDPLVAAERVIAGQLGEHPDATSALWYMRQVFVSRVFDVLDPESRNKKVAKHITDANQRGSGDRTLGGLLSDDIPAGAHSTMRLPAGRTP